jgi:hypothetical protein
MVYYWFTHITVDDYWWIWGYPKIAGWFTATGTHTSRRKTTWSIRLEEFVPGGGDERSWRVIIIKCWQQDFDELADWLYQETGFWLRYFQHENDFVPNSFGPSECWRRIMKKDYEEGSWIRIMNKDYWWIWWFP